MANTLSGTFLYAKITEPEYKFESQTETEFSLQIVVDKETFKAFGKKYPKQKGKVIDTSDFEGIFKIPPVFPDNDEQYVLKLSRPGTYKAKEDGRIVNVEKKFWPKILVQEEDNVVALEEGILVANGSKGQVSYDENTNSYGTFAKLKNILIEELIEYKSTSSDAASDFGLSSKAKGSEDFKAPKETPKEETKAKVAPKKTKAPVTDEDDPF
jgi:hypothetical protein